jgi:S1-C subfamily serine protease
VKKAAFGIIALFLAGCATTVENAVEERTIDVETGFTPAGVSLSKSMPALLSQTGPSYVTLIVNKEQGNSRLARDTLPDAVTSGSGFVIDNAGHVLTAGHVAVSEGYTVNATGPDGRVYEGKVIAVRPNEDSAIVRLTGFNGSPVTPVANGCLRSGEPVFSLGKPHARGDTARTGEVQSMSFGRQVTYDGFGYPDAMVLRMSTKKGESGGPVFNAQGQLSGMLVSTLSDGNGRPLNLAHAIASPSLARFVCQHTACSAAWQALKVQTVKTCKT